MEEPNLIHKTVKGREVRECRTCANERFTQMRKSKRDKQTEEPPMAAEANEQPAETTVVKATEVDPMDFLEESAAKVDGLDEVDQDFLAEHETGKLIDEAALQPREDQSPRTFDYPIGGIVPAGEPQPVIPHECEIRLTDAQFEALKFNNDRISEGLKSGELMLDTSFRHGPDGAIEPLEVSVILAPKTISVDYGVGQDFTVAAVVKDGQITETLYAPQSGERLVYAEPVREPGKGRIAVAEVKATLHAPHGTPVSIPTPKPKPRIGCGHGFANAILCPQCRANRRS